MAKNFGSAYLLISRAQEHLDDLETEVKKFQSAPTFETTQRPSADGRVMIYSMQFTDDTVLKLHCLCFDVTTNLRAALDHACASSFRAFNPNCSKVKNCQFPVAKDQPGLDRAFTKNTRLPAKVVAVIKKINPQAAGNKMLCGLNQARNAFVHFELIEVVGVTAKIKGGSAIVGPAKIGSIEKWDPILNRLDYAEMDKGSVFNHSTVPVLAQLGKGTVLHGEDLIPTLHKTLKEVEQVVKQIEMVCPG